MFQRYIQKQLERYVRQYFRVHPEVKLVVIVGTTDKAITRRAIGTVLAQKHRVRLREHQRASPMAPMLAILGITPPSSQINPLSWLQVLFAARQRVKREPDVDVIVQELTIRAPGDMNHFASYLKPQVAVVTSIAPESIEMFGSIDGVAAEYLAVADMAELVIINRETIDGKYAQYLRNAMLTTYGTSDMAEYWAESADVYTMQGTPVQVSGPEFASPLAVRLQLLGASAIMSCAAAAAVGSRLGLDTGQITAGLERVDTLPGRMKPLRGIAETLIIDDTYRAHPANAMRAIQALYEFDAAPQRIAVLSSFPNLETMSEQEHTRIGKLCNPDLLAWVVMVGKEAEMYMAPAARKRGCQVKVCQDAIEAGQFVRSVTERGAVILVEGAGPETYLEETTKTLCEMTEERNLVRQTPEWRLVKDEHFSRFAA